MECLPHLVETRNEQLWFAMLPPIFALSGRGGGGRGLGLTDLAQEAYNK